MKKLIYFLIIMIGFLACEPIPVHAQTKEKTVLIGKARVPDTTLVRTGNRGSKYIFRKSSKTGKIYKYYLPKNQ